MYHVKKHNIFLIMSSGMFFAFAIEQETLWWAIAGAIAVSFTLAYIVIHDIVIWRNNRAHIRKIKIIIANLNKFYRDGNAIRFSVSAHSMTVEEHIATIPTWQQSIHQYLEQNCPDMVERFNILSHESRTPVEELTDRLAILSEIIWYYQERK